MLENKVLEIFVRTEAEIMCDSCSNPLFVSISNSLSVSCSNPLFVSYSNPLFVFYSNLLRNIFCRSFFQNSFVIFSIFFIENVDFRGRRSMQVPKCLLLAVQHHFFNFFPLFEQFQLNFRLTADKIPSVAQKTPKTSIGRCFMFFEAMLLFVSHQSFREINCVFNVIRAIVERGPIIWNLNKNNDKLF